MRAVLPLDSSLPLRRTGRDHRDPQLRAHAPKLRDRLFSSQLLLHRGRTFVHILPIHVHRLRHAVPLDPGAQRIHHRPDRLLLTQPRPRRAGGVGDQIDQAALRAALLQPSVKAAVHLHHLPKMLLTLPAEKMPPPFSLATPQPFRQHPPPQRFGMHLQPVLRRQVLGRQRRPKSLAHRSAVLFPHPPQHLLSKLLVVSAIRASSRQGRAARLRPKPPAPPPAVFSPPPPQHLLSKLLVVSAIRASSRTAVLQPRSSFLPIPLPQPLRLPVAHAQQSTGIQDPQLFAAHPRQYLHSSQLPFAHLCPPQSDLLSEVLLRGHFYRGQKGTLSSRDNSSDRTARIDAFKS